MVPTRTAAACIVFAVATGAVALDAPDCSRDVQPVLRQLAQPGRAAEALQVVVEDLMSCNADGVKIPIFESARAQAAVIGHLKTLTPQERVIVQLALRTNPPYFKRFIFDDEFANDLADSADTTYGIYQRPGLQRLIDGLETVDPMRLVLPGDVGCAGPEETADPNDDTASDEPLCGYLAFLKRVDWHRFACCGSDPNVDTSYASAGLDFMLEDIRDVELARRSVAVKLLAQDGIYDVPRVMSYFRLFAPGGLVTMRLPTLRWRKREIPRLQRLAADSPYDFYRNAAGCALTRIAAGNRLVVPIGDDACDCCAVDDWAAGAPTSG